jgi:hypothetical protein
MGLHPIGLLDNHGREVVEREAKKLYRIWWGIIRMI